jgi:hypothetical protein
MDALSLFGDSRVVQVAWLNLRLARSALADKDSADGDR